jgi:hypothetical protein
MKRQSLLSPPRTTSIGFGLLGACALSACQLSAQTGGYQPPASQSQAAIDQFYQRGDAMSERVSGFMKRIFGGGQRSTTSRPVYPQQPVYSPPTQSTYPPASGAYQPGQISQPPPISNYERPAAPSSAGVYGYSTPPAASSSKPSPAQPAARSASSTRKPLFSSKKNSAPSAPTTPSRPTTYVPPQIKEQPVVKQTPPAPTPQPKNNSEINDFLPPGTVLDQSPSQPKTPASSPQSTTLGSIMTTTPESTKKEPSAPLPPASTSASDGTPVGKKGSKAGRVVSPFPPHNELDVTGLESGSLALDPTTNKVFKVP